MAERKAYNKKVSGHGHMAMHGCIKDSAERRKDNRLSTVLKSHNNNFHGGHCNFGGHNKKKPKILPNNLC